MLIHKALRCGLAEVGARQTLKISPALHSSPRLFPFPSDQSRAESDGSEISQQADTDTSPPPRLYWALLIGRHGRNVF